MKKFMSMFVFSLCFSLSIFAQKGVKSEKPDISKTVKAFAKAGDNQEVADLEKVLDSNYRIVMNQLFGSKEVSIMDRATYLEKIRTKEFGGQKREITITGIMTNGNTAVAKVIFKGSKMSVSSLIELVKTNTGIWLISSETPVML